MMKRHTLQMYLLAFLLVLSTIGMGAASPVLAAETDELPQIIARTSPSVVAIIGKPSSGKADKDTDKDRYNLAHGTGVIIKSSGVIITNAHVVKSMSNLVIVTSDGKSHNGKVTHLDEQSDLALVKIEATGLPAAAFANPKDVHVGETVVAIGTPVSFALRNSVTVGIVSGIDRSVNNQYQLIQTDAAINPGNSGGALVNKKGEVVGINTLKYAEFGVDNLGFAIPVDTINYVLKHFEAYGKVKRPYLGLKLEESWEAIVGLPSDDGLSVDYVEPDSPAAKAGFKEGDNLISLGGTSVTTAVQYNELLKQYLPGQKVSLTVQSGGSTVNREVTLGEEADSAAKETVINEDSGLNTDRGKTKIGDSVQGWSMKYPSGLSKQSQSAEGEKVQFADAKGEFSLAIQVESLEGRELSAAALLKMASEAKFGTTLEKQYVKNGNQPYAKVVGKLGDAYYQIRLHQHKDKLYMLLLTYYQDPESGTKLGPAKYNDLLDSFKTSFDSKDTKLKDIARPSGSSGQNITNDFGVVLTIPDKWRQLPYSPQAQFYNDSMTQSLSIDVTSLTEGDTLEAWAARDKKNFEETYTAPYREISDVKVGKIDGMISREQTFSSTMGDKWESEHHIYVVKDSYKYKFSIYYPEDLKEDEADRLKSSVIASIRIDGKSMDPAIGIIQDENELLDKDKTTTVINKDYGYSVKLPETWTEEYASEYEDSILEDGESFLYSFIGGYLAVDAVEGDDWKTVAGERSAEHEDSSQTDSDYKYTSKDIQLFGTTARKLTVNYSVRKVAYEETEYIFSRNGYVYLVRARINDAVRTDANKERLEKALQSLEFQK
ncbi:S1C family serine protease [Paenibacillus lutrae]|uniref:Trypsin-like serine protease n=1 Tax=Paenibacillus lutrae TaxID=2078573 RepID=A0A7X3FLX0_9BACL|nr:S1C family serine protease [Paenibacillus lutrae]MVP01682.1 trypsin-like serine protease [Paenibacillus lutrae]